MYCEHCGHKIKDRYCDNCGYDNEPENQYRFQAEKIEYKSVSKRRLTLRHKLILGLVIIFVIGILFFRASPFIFDALFPRINDNSKDLPDDYTSIENSTEFSFRNAEWGMTVDELLSVEDLEVDYKSDDYCVYNNYNYDNDFTAQLMYLFDDGELYSIVLRKSYSMDEYEDCIDESTNLLKKLISSYGSWNTEKSNDEMQANDNFIRNFTWTVSDTKINLLVREENDDGKDEVNLYLMFIDKDNLN